MNILRSGTFYYLLYTNADDPELAARKRQRLHAVSVTFPAGAKRVVGNGEVAYSALSVETADSVDMKAEGLVEADITKAEDKLHVDIIQVALTRTVPPRSLRVFDPNTKGVVLPTI